MQTTDIEKRNDTIQDEMFSSVFIKRLTYHG
jgi:hypothetical protein